MARDAGSKGTPETLPKYRPTRARARAVLSPDNKQAWIGGHWIRAVFSPDRKDVWSGSKWVPVEVADQPALRHEPFLVSHSAPVSVALSAGTSLAILTAGNFAPSNLRPLVDALASLPVLWTHTLDSSFRSGRIVVGNPFAGTAWGSSWAAAVMYGILAGTAVTVFAGITESRIDVNLGGWLVVISGFVWSLLLVTMGRLRGWLSAAFMGLGMGATYTVGVVAYDLVTHFSEIDLSNPPLQNWALTALAGAFVLLVTMALFGAVTVAAYVSRLLVVRYVTRRLHRIR